MSTKVTGILDPGDDSNSGLSFGFTIQHTSNQRWTFTALDGALLTPRRVTYTFPEPRRSRTLELMEELTLSKR